MLIVMLITPCPFLYNCNIDRKAISWIDYFKDKDIEGLLSVFCSAIKENYADETKEEIRKAFEFIDGDIKSFKIKKSPSSL